MVAGTLVTLSVGSAACGDDGSNSAATTASGASGSTGAPTSTAATATTAVGAFDAGTVEQLDALIGQFQDVNQKS